VVPDGRVKVFECEENGGQVIGDVTLCESCDLSPVYVCGPLAGRPVSECLSVSANCHVEGGNKCLSAW
jgi:hypothetical protein